MIVYVVYNDHKTLLVNPNCCMKLILNYIRISLKIHPKREFDLTNGNGDFLELSQLDLGESGLLLLKPREVYFVVTFSRNQIGKRTDYRPLLDESSPHFKVIKERHSKLFKGKIKVTKSISLPEGEKVTTKKRLSIPTDPSKLPFRSYSMPDLNGGGGAHIYSIPMELPSSIDTVTENKEKLVGSFDTDFQKQFSKAKAQGDKIKRHDSKWSYPHPVLTQVTSDELMKDANGKLVVTEDGYTVDKNGYLRDTEGRLVRQDEYFVDKEGLLRTEDGDLVVNNGFYVNKGGNMVTTDGYVVSQEGLLLNKNGERLVVNGHFVNKDGMLVKENGDFVKSKDGYHYLDKNGLLRDSNGEFVKTYQGFFINDSGLLADADGKVLRTKENHLIDKNLYLVDENQVPVRDAFGRVRKAIPSQLTELLFEKDSITGKYITTPDGHFVDKKGFARDKDGNFVLGIEGFRVNKDGILVYNDGRPAKRDGYYISQNGLYIDDDGKLVTSFNCNIGADGFLRTHGGELITVDDYVINAKGQLCTKDGNVVIQDGYAINKDGLLTDLDGNLKQSQGFFVNRDGILCDEMGKPKLQDNAYIREDGLKCDINGTPIKKNGRFVNKEGVLCDSTGNLVQAGDLFLSPNNILCDEKGNLATSFGHNINKDGVLCDNEGHLLMVDNNYVNKKGILCNRDGEPLVQEDGKFVNKDGLICDKNGNLEMVDNKFYVGKDGLLKDHKGNAIKKNGHNVDRNMLLRDNNDEPLTKDGYFLDINMSLQDKDGTTISKEIYSEKDVISPEKNFLLRDKNGKLMKKNGHYVGKDNLLYNKDGTAVMKNGHRVDANNLLRDDNGKILEIDGKYVDGTGNLLEKYHYEKPAAQQTLVFKERISSNATVIFSPGTTLQLKEKDDAFFMGNMDARKCRYVEQEMAKRKRALRLGLCHDYDIVHGMGPPNKKWWTPTGQLMISQRSAETPSYTITRVAKTLTKATQTETCYAVKTLAEMKDEKENYHKKFEKLMPKV
ncbi:uncharacterized protein LOC106672303 isoform X1 [Cimex lectularius]|uniref:Uncharacterized protein n=1 Tax=Cimex lectularius TaxID=79782 RepID=A0A8I6S7E2_CIMLE|nr:uncharacterized protein LOC106672303 isoform X1 [Cimex lectularius]